MPSTISNAEAWPSLPLEAWSDTCATLHMWTQIVGKIRLTQSPWKLNKCDMVRLSQNILSMRSS